MSIPDKYKFRYRLLASADVIGSTAFKTGQARDKLSWAHVFSGFFDEFPKVVASCFQSLDDSLVASNAKPGECMSVWKFVGDEILFHSELNRHEEAAYHVIALKHALNTYSGQLHAKHPGLGLKGTVWGAGFPVLNVEVETLVADRLKARDFLGPSIDLGFRLSSVADARRIPISADVALFLRHARTNSTTAAKQLKIFADPPQILKGIQAGGGYPMLWVDRLDGKQTAEDKLLGRLRDGGDLDADLLEYLEEQFRTGAVGLVRPFIESDGSSNFNLIPTEFHDRRKKLLNEDQDLKYRFDIEQADPAATAIPPPLPSKITPNSAKHGGATVSRQKTSTIKKKSKRRPSRS